jgi:periplasmic divalent cation tolerance protein
VSEHVLALSTVGKREDADRLARALVEARLAACVNIVPGLTSVYRWKDAVESDPEHLLVIKTRRDRLDDMRTALLAQHPYEVPELVVLPIEGGSPAYLAWLDAAVAPA